jgi:hypothetical protein
MWHPRITAAVVATATVLAVSGCAEAIPGSGTTRSLTITVATSLPSPVPPVGGHIDSQKVEGPTLTVAGWADLSDTDAATLTVVSGTPVTVVSAYRVVRPDVTVATNDRRLVWSGFSVTVRGSSTSPPAVICLVSDDPVLGRRLVGGSDTRRCAA